MLKTICLLSLFTGFIFTCTSELLAQGPVLVIHGGAGNINRNSIPDSAQVDYINALEAALEKGFEILENGGTSLQAVNAAINLLEDSPLFNAGKGAVFTNSGTNEMDASVMDGATLNAGAVAGVRHIRNPIDAAIAVMQRSPHVLMSGQGAELFAKSQGIEMVDTSYFYTERRYNQLQKAKQRENQNQGMNNTTNKPYKYGTVGAVALDKQGNIVAGTSTGGMTNKKYGRIGDSPIIGAGTYANNNTCGISATGHGEFFMRSVVAYDISALMEYKGLSLKDAAEEVVNNKLMKLGGSGGVVGLDAEGNVVMSFNSTGMFRGYIKKEGEAKVYIFED